MIKLIIRESIEIYYKSSHVGNDTLSFRIPSALIECLDGLHDNYKIGTRTVLKYRGRYF